MQQRVLITGASGLLGREVFKALARVATVEGWAFSRAEKFRRIDLLDRRAVEEGIRAFAPTAVVHCAAERRPDVMERKPEESRELNVGATGHLAELCARTGALFVFMSTDYVFDGTSPPYGEEAAPAPLNLYGQSKVEAEAAVRKTAGRHCILRVPILYGPTEDLDESAVTVLAGKLIPEPGQEKSFDDGAVRYPTHTTDVAEAIALLVRRGEEGTVHCSAEEPFTKYGMAVVMAEALGLATEVLFPDPGPPGGARRPLNAHLNNTRLRRLGFRKYRAFREEIGSVLAGAAKGPRHG
jgi:S-adenosylmethionine synthetase